MARGVAALPLGDPVPSSLEQLIRCKFVGGATPEMPTLNSSDSGQPAILL